MNKRFFPLLFAFVTLPLLSSGLAADADAGFGPNAPRLVIRPSATDPLYFRPTQRFYGKGYTVAYRYIPITRRLSKTSTTIGTEELKITPAQRAAWGIQQPRVTLTARRKSDVEMTTTTTTAKTSVPVTTGPAAPLPTATTTTTTTTTSTSGVPPVVIEPVK